MMKSLATASNMSTFSKSSSTTPTHAISIVYSFRDDHGKAQASVCYASQYQRHAANGIPIKTYNTMCQQALLIGFEVDLRQTPAGHGATCPDGKIMSESSA
jgi:exo-beta-1,3-glucanase (GH17 family)